MAIGTPVSNGTTTDAGATDPYTLSTTATVPSGALVVLVTLTGNTTNMPTYTVNGGGLTWSEDKQQTFTSGSTHFKWSIWSAPAPSGLASSTTLNMDIGTGSGTTYSGLLSCFYITGVSSESDRVNMTDGTFTTSSVATWDSTSSSTTLANCILIGAAMGDSGSPVGGAPTGSATEIHELSSSDNIGLLTGYRIVSATGSYGYTGNWTLGNPTGGSGASVCAYRSDEYDAPPWDPEVDSAMTMHVVSAPRF